MRNTLTVLMTSIVCLATQGARAEIASDLITHDQGRTALYYLEGTDIVRRICDDDAVIYDHATCSKLERRAPAHRVFAKSAETFGGDLPQLQARLGQLKTGIDRIDVRLHELLETPVGPDTDALRAAIERLVRDYAEQDVSVRDLADQVARLEAEVARGDLVAEEQLRLTGAAHARAVGRLTAIATEIQAKRQELVEASAANPDTTFQGLLRDRERLTDDFASTKWDLDREVEEAIGLGTLYTRLADTGFAYVHLRTDRNYEDTYRVLCGHDYPSCSWQQDSFDKHFMTIDQELRTFTGTASADLTSVTLDITRDDGIETAECTFDHRSQPGGGGARCTPEIRVRGPHGYDVTVGAMNTAGEWFSARPWARYANVSDELWFSLIGAPSEGRWQIELGCEEAGVAPYSIQAECTFTVLGRSLWNRGFCPQSERAPCNQ